MSLFIWAGHSDAKETCTNLAIEKGTISRLLYLWMLILFNRNFVTALKRSIGNRNRWNTMRWVERAQLLIRLGWSVGSISIPLSFSATSVPSLSVCSLIQWTRTEPLLFPAMSRSTYLWRLIRFLEIPTSAGTSPLPTSPQMSTTSASVHTFLKQLIAKFMRRVSRFLKFLILHYKLLPVHLRRRTHRINRPRRLNWQERVIIVLKLSHTAKGGNELALMGHVKLGDAPFITSQTHQFISDGTVKSCWQIVSDMRCCHNHYSVMSGPFFMKLTRLLLSHLTNVFAFFCHSGFTFESSINNSTDLQLFGDFG